MKNVTSMGSTDFILRQQALKFLLLQRTDYQLPIKSFFMKIGLGRIYNWLYLSFLMPIFERGRLQELSLRYYEDVSNDFKLIKDYLPIDLKNILDIGCGLGGINVFLNWHYQGGNPNFFLLDKDELSEDIYYLFNQVASAYNSFVITKRFLTDNGLLDDQINLIDINTDTFPIEQKFDLIVSLISWGFHYPIDVYLNEVQATLKDSGRLVVDVRNGTDGLAKLKNSFINTRVVKETNTRKRVVASNKAC